MEVLPLYLQGFLVILLATSFVKVATTLSILKQGIGIEGVGFSAVVCALALALSVLVMDTQLVGSGGLQGVLSRQGSSAEIETTFSPFLAKHADPEVMARLSESAKKLSAGVAAPEAVVTPQTAAIPAGEATPAAAPSSFGVLLSAFLLSELKEAFELGLILLIPFVVIDLLLTNIFMVLGVTQLSQAVVALPLKILLFFAVDGWALLSEKLLGGYL